MTQIIDLAAIARAQQEHRTSAQGVSHQHDTDTCYKTSPLSTFLKGISHELPPDDEEITEIEVETAVLRQTRSRQTGWFLKGPIPLSILAAATHLPGRALALYLLIHHRVTLTRQPQVTLPKKLLDSFGIGRDAKARGLHDLEQAGLIEVERAKGRTALVSLRNAASNGG